MNSDDVKTWVEALQFLVLHGLVEKDYYGLMPTAQPDQEVFKTFKKLRQKVQLRDAFAMDDLLKEHAITSRIDEEDPLWRLKVVTDAALKNPDFSKALGRKPRPGAPKKGTVEKFEKVRAFVCAAYRVKVLMQLRRGQPVTDFDVAREIQLRIDKHPAKLVDSPEEWPSDDGFVGRVKVCSVRISEYRRHYWELLNEVGLEERPALTGINGIVSRRHRGTHAHNWAPSTAELERYPEWEDELRKMMEEDWRKRRSRSRSRKP